MNGVTAYDDLASADDKSHDVSVKVLKAKPGCFGARHTLALLAFLGFFNVYAMRVNLSVALVEMVNSTGQDENLTSECISGDGNNTFNSTISTDGEFNWNQATQGTILSSFFYGYIVTQIPGGWLAERYGAKRLFGVGVLCTSIFTLLTPIAARIHVGLFIAVRVLEGIGEGVTMPAIFAMWGRWAPPLERSKLAAFTGTGTQAGTVLSLPLSGLLCQSSWGWPSVFYVFGCLGVVWFMVWMAVVHDSPKDHPRISWEEREYIEESLKAQHSLTSSQMADRTIPLAALKSPVLWGLTFTQFCFNWGFYTLLTCLPTYMKRILGFDITKDSFLSAVPYLSSWIVMLIVGPLSDLVRERGYFSTAVVRKFNTTIGGVGCLVPLVLVAQLRCQRAIVTAILSVAGGFGGFFGVGFAVNHLDIAPTFAGTLYGITNTAGTLSGILAPQVVGFLTNEQETIARWSIVFYIAAGLYLLGIVVFLVFGSGEVQHWARDDYNRITDKNEGDSPCEHDKLINTNDGIHPVCYNSVISAN